MAGPTASVTPSLTPLTAALLAVCAWFVPGVGHLWLRRTQKGIVFLAVLPVMFAIGLALQGRLFPFHIPEPLVALAALADLGIGALYFVAWGFGLGAGNVVAPSYEYGNTFLIVAGLLNVLVALDTYDIAVGRK